MTYAPGVQITIDTNDPAPLMTFWCEVLGYVPEPPPGGYPTWLAYWIDGLGIPAEEFEDGDDGTSIVDPGGQRPRIWFQPVPEPKVVKNRLHLDVVVAGGRDVPKSVRRPAVDAEAERLVALGASIVRVLHAEGSEHYGVVMRDPQGNEFCLT